MGKIETELPKEADIFLFIGQSNMAGRGIVSERWPQKAPECITGAGYEYRAVSDPCRLHPLREPFGLGENREGGIWEPGKKSGSMVTAFVNAYYMETKTPVVGVSAALGGTAAAEWLPGGALLRDALFRLSDAVCFLQKQKIHIRHQYMLWCQGETDGDLGITGQEYKASFEKILGCLIAAGIEHCFMVRIGGFNGAAAPHLPPHDYAAIRQAQEELAAENAHITMVSRAFLEMKERGLMADAFHYYQQAYNEVGAEAGARAAQFVMEEDGKRPQ